MDARIARLEDLLEMATVVFEHSSMASPGNSRRCQRDPAPDAAGRAVARV
jgi:hypothetical protein